MNQHQTWLLEIVKQVPALTVLAVVVWMFLAEADANTKLIVATVKSFGVQVGEMHQEMVNTHAECHVVQKHSIQALEQDASARREQTKVMERLAAEIRRRMPGGE